jgi:hypothetical protein
VRQAASGAGWDVVGDGAAEVAAHGETQSAAIGLALELARAEGGGEIRIVDQTGKVVGATRVTRPARGA